MNKPSSAGIVVGLRARAVFDVVELDTASALGSGSVPALGTPRLLAWLEAVTCAALDPALADDEVSVGTHVDLDHLRASRVGARVRAEAIVVAVEGRRVDFDVEASDGDGDGAVIGRGRITRTVVDRERFVDRLGPINPG
ncbi:MAG: thioesterase [Actinomycetota bacterium]|nr:thioesterase [Actinomycetota bacterium]